MKSMTVSYLAHPVAGLSRVNLTQSLNGWMALLARHYPGVAFNSPWLPYVLALDDADPEQRKRGMRDDLEILLRCDEVWLLGERVSPGMRIEAKAAWAAGKPVRRIRIVHGGLYVETMPEGSL